MAFNGLHGSVAEGCNFGPEMLAATEEATWVSYVYNNPGSDNVRDDHPGAVEPKHVWLVSNDGLTFGSGWYHNEPNRFAREFPPNCV